MADPHPRASGGPSHRPRRLRATATIRDSVAETSVAPGQLIAPVFVTSGGPGPVDGMPGVERFDVDGVLRHAEACLAVGVRSLMLFGVVPTADKDPQGTAASDPRGPVARALVALRKHFEEEMHLVTDVCLCGYTDHGHCGILRTNGRAAVDGDATLPRLAAMAVVHAEAGADMVAPSDMMDGRVAAIRRGLDGAGLGDAGIMSYAVKYASAFYGPFREAAGSSPGQGDRSSYQMDPRNVREARREALLDAEEGADVLMVKPALAYLDVIREVRSVCDLPVAAYNVSGEYAMVKLAAAAGALDEPRAVREVLLSMRRAGADMVITYHALQAAAEGWLG